VVSSFLLLTVKRTPAKEAPMTGVKITYSKRPHIEVPMSPEDAKAFVLKMAKGFSRYSPDEPDTATLDNGTVIQFYRVGRNASHEFYVGFDTDGGLWSSSIGDDYEVDSEGNYLRDDTGYPIFMENQLKRYARPYDPNSNTYLGHY
jgi:hypothetical protein